MAYTTINKSTDYFNTKLYTGNGSTNNITGVGFQPDWTWIKNRSGTDSHSIYDAVRGVNKVIRSNTTGAEGTQTDGLTAFGTDGFTVGAAGSVNTNSNNFASWNWKAGTTGSGNTTGSGTYKTYNYSVNTTAGFSIIKFQGNGTAGHTIPHHLGVAPDLVFLKNLGTTNNWYVWGSEATGIAANKQLELDNNTAAYNPNGNYHNDTRPTSSVITLGDDGGSNGNNNNIIIYAFASKTGYSKIGSYIGNGNADGTFVYTGFRPSFVMNKKTDGAMDWHIWDNKRNSFNVIDKLVYPNLNNGEDTLTSLDFVSNGFKIRDNRNFLNQSGSPYMYMAFGQSIVGSNNVPCTSR